jgi:hypothetical protein
MPVDPAWGQKTAGFVPIAIAGALVFVAFVIAVLSYVRCIDAIARIIREKQPSGWKLGMLDTFQRGDATNPRQVFWP